jgi:hypothetical protein
MIDNIAAVFTAIGTVAVAVLAIWGSWVRDRVAGPKLRVSLLNSHGNLTVQNDGKRAIYYHLSVVNERRWSTAEKVRVLVTGIAKRRPDGSFAAESLTAPLQLTWAYSEFHEQFPTIGTPDTCDFGYLLESDGTLKLSTYITPNNFQGFIVKDEAIRVTVIAAAHNGESKPIVVEVHWDGQWSTDLSEMQRHLVIKQLS